MEIIQSVAQMAKLGKEWRQKGLRVGLVPTMGFLHQGHLTLAKAAVAANHITVLSIFVNPIQFGANEDLERYPKDLEGDAEKAAGVGVDYVFAPTAAEMYPPHFATTMDLWGITQYLCGRSRPGHFQGVAVVVTKLFHLVQPDNAYFGQKDGQQLAVIRRFTADLNFPIHIVAVPIVREEDGLALSSRNVYLAAEGRKQALALSQSLGKAKAAYEAGLREPQAFVALIEAHLAAAPLAQIEYVQVVDAFSMEPVETLAKPVMIALAVWFEGTRLIDNLLLGSEQDEIGN